MGSLRKMDAIKKKMQAMKVEKDNAMDRSDACEQATKEAKIRAEKAEEEVAELVKKSQQLEVDLDKTSETLLTTTQQLEEKEKALLEADLERAEERAETGETKIMELEEELRVVGNNLK